MSDGNFIEVTELRAIKSDASNWMLMRRTKKTDKDTGKPSGGYSTWEAYKYPSTYQSAVRILEEELIRTSGASTLTELLRSAKKIHAMLMEIEEKARLV